MTPETETRLIAALERIADAMEDIVTRPNQDTGRKSNAKDALEVAQVDISKLLEQKGIDAFRFMNSFIENFRRLGKKRCSSHDLAAYARREFGLASERKVRVEHLFSDELLEKLNLGRIGKKAFEIK